MDQKLLTTIAEISYMAGHRGYYSGDSRADISEFIWWAKEFEHIHLNTNWYEEDYMLTVEDFTLRKLAKA